jgi:hypothetical protein
MTIIMNFEEGVKTCRSQFQNLVFMEAIFPASTEKLHKLLPTKKLKPIESTKGITHVKIDAFEYREWYSTRRGKDPLPPYNEWTVVIPVNYVSGSEQPVDGGYVVWMPVTHELPMRGGIDLWGFNKFMSEIRFSENKDARTCEVAADGKMVIKFTVKKLTGSETQEDVYIFNKMGDKLTRTLVQFKGSLGVSHDAGSATFELGDHPIGKQMASIKLENKPVEARYGVGVRANLHDFNKTFTL